MEDARLGSYYLERGIPHTVLEGLTAAQREFYIASMQFHEEGRAHVRDAGTRRP